MPLTEPSIHKSIPLVLTALRGLPALVLPLVMSESAVVVSTMPLESTRAITRLIELEPEVVILAVPTSASYPVAVKYRPSLDKVIKPSLVPVPLAVSLLFEPLTAVGIGIDWTKPPAIVYSSRKTGVALP